MQVNANISRIQPCGATDKWAKLQQPCGATGASSGVNF